MKKNMAQALMYIDSWPGFVYYVPRKLPRFYHRDTRIYGSRALWRKIWHRRGCWRANSSEKAVARWSIGNIVIAVILEDLRIKPRDGSTTKRHMPLEEVTEGPIPGYTKNDAASYTIKKGMISLRSQFTCGHFSLGGNAQGCSYCSARWECATFGNWMRVKRHAIETTSKRFFWGERERWLPSARPLLCWRTLLKLTVRPNYWY